MDARKYQRWVTATTASQGIQNQRMIMPFVSTHHPDNDFMSKFIKITSNAGENRLR